MGSGAEAREETADLVEAKEERWARRADIHWVRERRSGQRKVWVWDCEVEEERERSLKPDFVVMMRVEGEMTR